MARYYLPGFKSGGPVRSLANLVRALGDAFEFHLICQDRDRGDRKPYPQARPGEWLTVEGAQVRYLSPWERTPLVVGRLIRELRPDLLYVNGFWHPIFSATPIWLRQAGLLGAVPLLVAPRGQFAAGALGLKSAKKQAYLRLYRSLPGRRPLSWHATSEGEAADLEQVLGVPRNRITVVANASAAFAPPGHPSAPASDGPLQLVYLSRIARVKNTRFALQVLSRLRRPVHFDLWGPIEDPAYWRECSELLGRLPPQVQVRYRGVADHAEVPRILADYDAFFVPTLGENHGHVFAEAFAAGLTVVTSDQTPWRSLAASGVGFDLPLASPEAFAEAIDRLASEAAQARAARKDTVLQWYAQRAQRDQALEQTRALFRSLL